MPRASTTIPTRSWAVTLRVAAAQPPNIHSIDSTPLRHIAPRFLLVRDRSLPLHRQGHHLELQSSERPARVEGPLRTPRPGRHLLRRRGQVFRERRPTAQIRYGLRMGENSREQTYPKIHGAITREMIPHSLKTPEHPAPHLLPAPAPRRRPLPLPAQDCRCKTSETMADGGKM